tara:strand:- start:255 stop:452 length:198 start_codon:yes stop_codon:yes gene_type:complete
MSMKRLLGLESFPIHETEIMAKIAQAQKNHLNEVVFKSNNHQVKINLTHTNPKGCMKLWRDYYEN